MAKTRRPAPTTSAAPAQQMSAAALSNNSNERLLAAMATQGPTAQEPGIGAGLLATASETSGPAHGEVGHDHSEHEGTFAGRPIEGELIAAGEDNPLSRQSDPLPAQEGEQKRTVCGIEITGTGVSPSAMDAAARVVEALLGANPTGAEQMAERKVRIVVVPATTDLPDVAGLESLDALDVRDAPGSTAPARQWRDTRGVGGHHANGEIIVAFPEENLIDSAVRHDGYGENQNISIHELAHAVQLNGFTEEQTARIAELYAQQQGATESFTDAYAASHIEEYFAQASQYFFAASNYSGAFNTLSDIDDAKDGPGWLRDNDRDMYDFLVSLYGTPGEGLDRAAAVDVRTHGQGAPVVAAAHGTRPTPGPAERQAALAAAGGG